jgi:hypothetical protein
MQTFYYIRGTADAEALAAKGFRLHVDAKGESWIYQCAGEEPPTDDGLVSFGFTVLSARGRPNGRVCRRQSVDLPTFLKGICETSEPPMGFQANSLN